MNVICAMKRPLDIIDLAVNRALSNFPAGVVEFTRIEEVPGRKVVYELQNPDPETGELGKIVLCWFGPDETECTIMDPPRPPKRRYTAEEARRIKAASDNDRYDVIAEIEKRRSAEAEELYKRRKRLQKLVISSMKERLAHDRMLSKCDETEGPKLARTKARYRQAMDIIEDERRYRRKFGEEPTDAELAEAIGEQMPEAWDGPPSVKTVRRIKRAAKTGQI